MKSGDTKVEFKSRVASCICLVSFFFLWVFSQGLHSQSLVDAEFRKAYYNVNDGLTQNAVTSILQDRYGFIWFGTRGGLNRFDGYEFLKFKPEPGDRMSLPGPSVETLYTDRGGDIWIGTKSGGLGHFELSSNSFTEPDSTGILPIRIISVFEDRQGIYWIGSWGNGLFRYDRQNGSITQFLERQRVNSIAQTGDGTLWLGTSNGLYNLNPQQKEVKRISTGNVYFEITEIVDIASDSALWMVGWSVGLTRFSYRDSSFLSFDLSLEDMDGMSSYSLLHDNGILWVGTWGNGLYRFNTKDHSSAKVALNPLFYNNPTMDLDIVLDIFRDSAGDIWIGTDGGGVVRLSAINNFKTLLSSQVNSPFAWHINSVCVSGAGDLYIGTRASGLYVTRKGKDHRFAGFSPVLPEKGSNRFRVKVLYEDPGDTLWVGLENGIFNILKNPDGQKILVNSARFCNSPDLLGTRKITGIMKYRGDLWVATQQDGLFWYENKGNTYRLREHFYTGDPRRTFKDNRISSLLVDPKNNLWIGTYKGLYVVRRDSSVPVPFSKMLSEEQELLCDIIHSAHLDREGRIWLGTPCSLNSLEEKENGTYVMKEYTNQNGLTDDYINAIQSEGNLVWVSTNAGISSLDPNSGEIRNYNLGNDIWSFSFSEGASAYSKDGTIYFGGSSDLVYFNPSALYETMEKPAIVITRFKVMNREIPVSKDGILRTSVNETESIRLNHRQKEFSFEIAALDYKAPQNNQYAYRLVNRHGEGAWTYTGQGRQVSFNNLSPGEYTLLLAGSDSNGLWNRDGRVLKIIILPPPWKTIYALAIYILVILGIVMLINRVYLRQERLRNEAEIEHMSRLKEKEINEFKLRFFTDISHELKTPLSLIQAPVEEMLSKEPAKLTQAYVRKRMGMIHYNTQRLIDLINQLLEFRKIEVGKARLRASEQNIATFAERICESYKFLADNKGKDFSVDIPSKTVSLWFEPSKMDMIIHNLLSNAFKYSGNPGQIRLQLTDTREEVLLMVSNDGKGISPGDMERVFDRFFQVEGDSQRRGFGIGLELVKRFVEMHGGTISVESSECSLTTFSIRFLKGKDHLSEQQITTEAGDQKSDTIQYRLPGIIPAKGGKVLRGTKGAKILVVEDNDEVRDYLVELLEGYYEVIVAEDGALGYTKTAEEMPDLVLSDVMMPGMDGFELCERIKKNGKTAHIPVVLLTAKGTSEDQLRGIRKGADAYIPKPFDPVFLQEKIKQLISSRHALAEKFGKKVSLEPLNKEISSEDEKLIRQVLSVIEKKMEDPELDSEYVAREAGMSLSTFYRRMKKLVSQSPGEFIRSTRMKMAARYLLESNLTVSEIVEKVGYSDAANFRDSFYAEFGMSPSEYRNLHKRT